MIQSDRVPSFSNGFALGEFTTELPGSVTVFCKEVGERCLDSIGFTIPVSLTGRHCWHESSHTLTDKCSFAPLQCFVGS